MDTLKSAFADINAALDDISTFRTKALPQMAQNIMEMDKLTQDAEKKIVQMEKANKAKPSLNIDPEVWEWQSNGTTRYSLCSGKGSI